MKIPNPITSTALLALLTAVGSTSVGAQSNSPAGTVFAYQGRLTTGENLANGNYDFIYTLYDDGILTNVIGSPITNPPAIINPDFFCPGCPVAVTNGLFEAALDFGPGLFNGAKRWLGIAVRPNGIGPFVTLSPRQQITPTPYALYAPSAGFANLADGISATAIVHGQSLQIGLSNTLYGAYGTIAGGIANTASNNLAAIGGGSRNVASGDHATVAGGEGNIASGSHSFVGGGSDNTAEGDYAAVVGGGGHSNHARGVGAFVGGGDNNTADADYSTISGGDWNTIQTNATESTIGGGSTNLIQSWANDSTIGGGQNNNIEPYAHESTIGGGNDNFIGAYAHDSTIGGGIDNLISPHAIRSTIGGGDSNQIQTNVDRATIGGGYGNNILSDGSFTTNYFSTIAGGGGNYIFGGSHSSTIGGGQGNQIRNNCVDATIAGGESNFILTNATKSTIAGGYGNSIQASDGATIGGGLQSLAAGSYSTVPGGYENKALGKFSFAAGDQAVANHAGTFVWADSTPDVNFSPWTSTAPNQFLVRATNGVGININNPFPYALYVNGTVNATGYYLSGSPLSGLSPWNVSGSSIYYNGGNVGLGATAPAARLHVNGVAEGIRIQGTAAGNANVAYLSFYDGGGARTAAIGDGSASDGDLYLQAYTGNVVLAGSAGSVLTATPSGNVGIGTKTPGNLLVVGDSGSPAYCNGTTWVNGSDRDSKEAFVDINPRAVLDKVAALPIMEWKYKADADGRKHLGPVAQDFHTAFGLNGTDNKHIATVDEEGVALAAIQGLNQKVEEKDARIRNLENRNTSLEKRLYELEQFVQSFAEEK